MSFLKNNDLGIMILRVALGILMLFHGVAKIRFGTGFVEGVFEQHGLPGALAYLAYLGEVLAPLLLIIGWRTRIAAALVAGTMVVAVLTAMQDKIATVTEVGAWGLEVPALFFFGALALVFTGGGRYAVSTHNGWD
ncbi:DoxX family protein [Cruoricaptor ignavus]|uniref:DoxX family protein n=2 Tax=Cruoricaptor ignavus TaxID=1118202 RepID=A0A7M1T2N2_9FLAO|nr:DoxX family protein [Cruoricaptor ignavus]